MRRIVILLFILLCSSPVWSQSDSSRLLAALGMVPAEAFLSNVNATVTYSDLPAAFRARDLDVPENWQALLAEHGGFGVFSILPPAFPDDITRWLTLAGEYPDTLGIDFFDIAGTVEFGQFSDHVLGLHGNFDAAQVTARFGVRGYVAAELAVGGNLLCHNEQCDLGTVTDRSHRDPGNPFGGAPGRRQPAIVTDTFLVSSPSYASLMDSAAAIGAAGISMADLPEVQAVANVVEQFGHVLNVHFVNPLVFSVADPVRLVGNFMDPVAVRERIGELTPYPLPAYSLVAYAAAAADGTELGLAVMIYGNDVAALAAAEAVEARVSSIASLHHEEPYADSWSDAGEFSGVWLVPEFETGLWAVVVQLSAPQSVPGSSIDFQNTRSGLPFLRLMTDLGRRDVVWLLPLTD